MRLIENEVGPFSLPTGGEKYLIIKQFSTFFEKKFSKKFPNFESF